MIQKPLSATVYANKALSALMATGITQTSPGGKARAIADNIADMMGTLELRQFNNLVLTFLQYAGGDTLDFWGALYGVPRITRQDAVVDQSDQNFEFFVRYGNFGSINNGQDIVVPAGTQLYTASGLNGPIYITQFDVTLPADQTSVYFSAVAQDHGAASQIASRVITQCSFSGYADGKFGSLQVTNNFGVIAGRDDELDEDYKYRISLEIKSTGGSQEDDIRAALLKVSGVQDVDFDRKAGTFLAYIYGISPEVGSSLLQQCQSAIDGTVAFPATGLAVAPDLVGISFSTSVRFAPGTSASSIPQILQSAATTAQEYIDNLGKGSTFVINQVASQILGSDARILDIGQPNKPLDAIYIWRSRADGTRFSRTLVGDYSLELGERIVTENIPNAIQIVQAS